MAARLSRGWNLAAPNRRVAALALVLGVTLLHWLVTQEVLQRMADFAAASAMPQRIQVAYVRELEIAPPPPAPPVVVAPARPRTRPAAAPAATAAAPEPAASAPLAAADVAPAAPPEPIPAPSLAAEAAPLPAPEVAAEAAPAEAEAFDWPVSTRLTYVLTGNYRGELNGDAQVEWVRVGTQYQVHIDITLGPIISRRMSSQGELVGDRLRPSRYDEETRVLMRAPRRVTILFGADEVVLATGERRERTPDVQDSASQFIQLAAMFTTRPELLQAGTTLDMPLALRNRIGTWTYDVLGAEDIRTPFGPVATYHLKPRNVISRGNELSAEIWFAPQLRYLPVRIRVQQDEYTFIDLVIARRPEIAAQ
ncbi:MAG: DUF3108 domain-containing protein [Piscinibacter sp.]|nr:DUF3108 domain-containing protein [Piscinibacter sp.]